jgi:hypothetical protein
VNNETKKKEHALITETIFNVLEHTSLYPKNSKSYMDDLTLNLFDAVTNFFQMFLLIYFRRNKQEVIFLSELWQSNIHSCNLLTI